MKISICIPVFNGESSIRRLVDAVRSELAGRNLEFVLDNYLSSFKLIRSDVVREIIKYTGPFLMSNGSPQWTIKRLVHASG